MFTLPHRLPDAARSAAFILALGVMVAIATPAGAANSTHAATGQGRLEAEYVVSLSGLPIGSGSWVVEVSDSEYTAAASGATIGLLKFFTSASGTSAAHGGFTGEQISPSTYAATILDNRKVDQVRMALVGGNVANYTVDPPLVPLPDRIPLTDADRRGVLDPMTATLTRVAGTADPLSPEACHRRVPVFDGRVRYDLHSEFKRIDAVRADGYAGPVVVCAVYFQPIAGYVPDRAAIKYLAELRDAEVFLAPIAGTRVLVPFRFSLPTPIGVGVLQAKRFVSRAQPAHAAKTQ